MPADDIPFHLAWSDRGVVVPFASAPMSVVVPGSEAEIHFSWVYSPIARLSTLVASCGNRTESVTTVDDRMVVSDQSFSVSISTRELERLFPSVFLAVRREFVPIQTPHVTRSTWEDFYRPIGRFSGALADFGVSAAEAETAAAAMVRMQRAMTALEDRAFIEGAQAKRPDPELPEPQAPRRHARLIDLED